ncbi:MAG: hypothetical protein ACRDVG_00020, partial [Jatrophihabitantaceae bacterium]
AYHVARDGVMVATVTTGSDYIDWTAQANTTYSYSVSAVDVAGNESGATTAAPVTTGKAPNPVFADGFESGDLSAWTTTHGLTVQGATVHTGAQAAEGNTTTGAAYARKTLPASYPDVYARVAFDVVAQPDQVNLLRLRDPAGASLGYAYIETTGQLGYHNDALGTNTLSGVAPSAGWHVLELHRAADAAGTSTGALELWLDGAPVTDLSDTSLDVGAAPVGGVQIGETQTGQTYDVVFDDVAVGTSRLGTAADTTAPDVPTGLSATATAPFSADLTWTASSDDVAVTGYDVTRDGVVVASLGAVTAWTDSGTVAGSDHTYTVRARDAAGNVSAWSAPATVTQPPAAVPVFSDGFETGDLSAWTTTSNLGVQTADVRSGSYAAQANVTAAPGYAKRTLPATYTDAYSRVAFNAASMGTQVTLLRLRDTPTGNGGYVYLSATGRLAFRSDALMAGTVSGVAPGPGWHALELHLAIDTTTSTSGRVEVWLDGAPVPALTISGIDLGTAPVGVLQIGDTAVATADIRFDDAAFSTTRLGPAGDTSAPTAPDSLTATANSPFDVGLAWNASTDDVGVTRYDVYRDGTLLATLPGAATTYDDPTVAASTGYGYTVRARDAAGNVSPSAIATVTTPAPAAPVWSNGFETGDLTGWTTTAGLTVESTDVNTGAFAAEGSTTVGNTFAKKTLPATYTDAYAQVAFEIKSQPGQVNLLRLRTSAGGSIAFLYVNTSGKLGLHIDGNPSTEIVSGVLPGTGWHTLQLHADITGGNTEVWLDGTKVSALSLSGVNLGVAPVGAMQIGDATPARTYDVVFDDAAFSTSRL